MIQFEYYQLRLVGARTVDNNKATTPTHISVYTIETRH